jgi:cellulose synthase/poly-beta-1,6-N-acetylglucosamine synthase-like glycosyltransferase
MGHNYRLSGWPLVAATAFTGLLAETNYRRVPTAPAAERVDGGKVTIIVPARNEERRLPTLLASLQRLNYVNYEVVVIDDVSDDGTARVAEHMGANLVSVDHLPEGWTGKNHACWCGAERTSGEWLLFTDADTIHSPASLSVAIRAAIATDAGMVSFLCRQQCGSLWERLVLPYAYALYFAGRLTINASKRSAVANGQYILIRRSDYDRIGGHSAIRASVIDDVSLAQRAYACGVRVRLLRGEEWVGVRMYDGLSSLAAGLSKNAVSFLVASPAFGAITVAASLVFGAAIPVTARAASFRSKAAILAVPAITLVPWMRRFGVPSMYAFLYPLAAGVFQFIALDSMRRKLVSGGVQWKGRRY